VATGLLNPSDIAYPLRTVFRHSTNVRFRQATVTRIELANKLVRLDGAPPPMKPISMAAVPNCARLHSTPAMTEDVVPGDNGTLQNVVVYLKGDFTLYSFDAPRTPVTIDQKGCVYTPHVIALMTGQPLAVLNSDAVTHNIHAFPNANPEWNQSQSPAAAPIEQIFTREEVAIPLKCNVHAFMKAYIAVLGNPYFQVIGRDGSFSLKNVPPGTYTVVAWHELYGATEQSVTIHAKEAKTVTFTFKAAAATK